MAPSSSVTFGLKFLTNPHVFKYSFAVRREDRVIDMIDHILDSGLDNRECMLGWTVLYKGRRVGFEYGPSMLIEEMMTQGKASKASEASKAVGTSEASEAVGTSRASKAVGTSKAVETSKASKAVETSKASKASEASKASSESKEEDVTEALYVLTIAFRNGTYQHLGYAKWAWDHYIPWPAWQEGDKDPFNGERLGAWDGWGAGPEDVPLVRNNCMFNLVFVHDEETKTWKVANRSLYTRKLIESGFEDPFFHKPVSMLVYLKLVIYKDPLYPFILGL